MSDHLRRLPFVIMAAVFVFLGVASPVIAGNASCTFIGCVN